MSKALKLGVNIDHVATLRQQRKEGMPDLLQAANVVTKAGADYITVHLREDRRHIQDQDVIDLIQAGYFVNFECAATEEMLQFALTHQPKSCCLVPEKREELTTEGGLNLFKNSAYLQQFIKNLHSKNIKVSLFIDPSIEQVKQAKALGADIVELHTGTYAKAYPAHNEALTQLNNAAELAQSLELECHLGHGIDFDNITDVVNIRYISDLNIGFSIIANALFNGLEMSVKEMKEKLRRQSCSEA